MSGTTVIGRPLELSAPIQFDELTGGDSGCVRAEVLYGDKQVDGDSVDVELSRDAARQVSVARISSPVRVNEPFVTVVLHAGCQRPYTRRYLLLADAPKDEPILLGATSALALASPGPAPGSAVAAVPPRAGNAAPARPASPGGATSPVRSSVVHRSPAATQAAASRRAGRLELALWDPNSEPRMPWLRASAELRSMPSADAAHRAAAIALWRALNAQPQDLLRTAERLRGLEADVTSLRGLAASHRSEISSARESLQASRTRQHTSLAMTVLLAMLLGGGGAFFWHRRRAGAFAAAPSWYESVDPREDEDVVVDDTAQEPVIPPRKEADIARPVVVQPPPPAPRKQVSPEPAMLGALEFSLPDAPAPGPAATQAPVSAYKVDALHGAQQQSEFFASLGQVDEAVAVLTSYLDETRERPPLVYLELFNIYRVVGMRVEYEELQSVFRQTFGMDVPSFGEYKQDHRELEAHPVAITRIASAWPSRASQEIIEELLFRKPATPRDLLSLEAYRELLWLYLLGHEIVCSTGLPAGLQLLGDRGLPNNHFILPWAVGEQDGPPEISLDRLSFIDVAPELNAFAVDIDLTTVRAELPPLSAQAGPGAGAQSHDPDAFSAFDAAMESESRRSPR